MMGTTQRSRLLPRARRTMSSVMAALCVVAAAPDSGALVQAATAPTAALPLRAVGRTFRNAVGAEVVLRGTNVNALVQYWVKDPEAAPLGPGQVRLMAAMGFNVIRLALSLSALEPRPGVISAAYLNRIAAIVRRAQAQGIYVVLDLHQDRYSAGLFPGESDGMPPFMVRTGGAPTRPILFGITDPAVQAAFSAFWADERVDGRGLQSWYLDGLRALARRFRGNAAIAGYDIMNEPNPGLILEGFVARYLLPFYRRAVSTIRTAGAVQPIFLEPDIVSMELGDPLWPVQGLPSPRRNLVFSPHFYATGETGGTFSGASASGGLRELTQDARAAARQARHLSVPLFIGEFGAGPGSAGDAQMARDEVEMDRYGASGTYWLWSIRPGTYPWNLAAPDGALAASPDRLAVVAAPYAPVVGGALDHFAFDPGTRVLTGQATTVRAAGSTVVAWNSLTYPAGAKLTANRGFRLTSMSTRAGSQTVTGWRAIFPPASGRLVWRLAPSSAG